MHHTEITDSPERTSAAHLPPAHGGELLDLYANPDRRAEIKTESREYPSWDLRPRQLCDLELLLNGGFSPLPGFMTKADYERVCNEMRLTSGVLWTIPITLDVTEDFAKSLTPGKSKIALRDAEGVMLALLHVEEVWKPDRHVEAEAIFNTTSLGHPGVDYLLNKSRPYYIGGRLEGVQTPSSYDSNPYVYRRMNCGISSRGKAGAASSRSKRAIPCIVPMSN